MGDDRPAATARDVALRSGSDSSVNLAEGSPGQVVVAVNHAISELMVRCNTDRMLILGRVTILDQVLDSVLEDPSFQPTLTGRHPTGYVGSWRGAAMYAYSGRDMNRGELFVFALGSVDVVEVLDGIHPLGMVRILQAGWEEGAAP